MNKVLSESSQSASLVLLRVAGQGKKVNNFIRYTNLNMTFLVLMGTMSINGYSDVTSILKS